MRFDLLIKKTFQSTDGVLCMCCLSKWYEVSFDQNSALTTTLKKNQAI